MHSSWQQCLTLILVPQCGNAWRLTNGTADDTQRVWQVGHHWDGLHSASLAICRRVDLL